MKKKRIIIIGGGTAGIAMANHLQDSFEVTVIEKSANKRYPLLFGVPLLIGILFRRKKTKYVNKSELKLADGRKIPFYVSNLLGGASVMNGAVHVFGFKSKWIDLLRKFDFSLQDLLESNADIYSYDSKKKNKITLKEATLNFIDKAFFETLGKRNIELDDMSMSEKVSFGPIVNTVGTFFRTSVLSILNHKKFKIRIDEEVECVLFNEAREVTGVRTNKEILDAEIVILSGGVIGSCSLLLKQKASDQKGIFSNLSIGEHIQDHTNLRVNVLANRPLNSLNEIYASWPKKLLLGIKHFLGIPTIMRGTGATSAAYLDLDQDGKIDTRIQILQFAETGRHGSKGSVFSSSEPSFSISINAIHPESKGKISLINGTVDVNPNFLSSSRDIEILKLSLKYCIDLLKSPPIRDYVISIDQLDLIEKDPEKYIRDNIYSGHHLIGGLHDVVNNHLEVKNTNGLYICDASIFSSYVASNIHSSVLLIADLFAKRLVKKYPI